MLAKRKTVYSVVHVTEETDRAEYNIPEGAWDNSYLILSEYGMVLEVLTDEQFQELYEVVEN